MRINEAGILVILQTELFESGIGMSAIKHATARNQIQSTRAHRGQPAEIIWDSLPERYQQAFIQKFGNPADVLRSQSLEHYLNTAVGNEALEYYRGFITGNHKYLPDSYINKYSAQALWLDAVHTIINTSKADLKKAGFVNKNDLFQSLFKHPSYLATDLPVNYSKLCAKVRAFVQTDNQTGAARNYGALVSAKFGNKNTEKIGLEQREWLLAMYSNPALKYDVNRLYRDYNIECLKRGWKNCENPVSLHLWLNKPENYQVWCGAKLGEHKGRTNLAYVMKTALPTMRDSLWYSDGTKLNFFEIAGKTYTVYEVIDAYSEVLLGFSIMEGAENFQAQYTAYKMALQVSGQKPYEIRYDNQGGHKKMEAQQFFQNISNLNIRCKPYNGRSKIIESAFGRLQAQIMSKYWFFTGQNITSKKDNSHANRQFIGENKKYLPTIDELVEIYIQCRNEWNNELHPRYKKPRLELYNNSQNPELVKVDTLDMIDLFWFQKKSPITYYNSGIALQFDVKKVKTKYEFEVLTSDGMPDIEFRSKYLFAKFVVKYDPDDLSYVRLYEPSTMRFVAIAQPRLTVQRNIQEQLPGERAKISALLAVNTTEFNNNKQFITRLWEENGINPEEIVANNGKPAPVRKQKIKVPVYSHATDLKNESYQSSEDIWDNI